MRIYRVLLAIALIGCPVARPIVAQAPKGGWSKLNSYPWFFPSDFNERFKTSDLVVSGTIVSTQQNGTTKVDGEELSANIAEIEIDRVFKGEMHSRLQFTWYTFAPYGGGMVYSGPPLADFRSGTRYLVLLRKKSGEWVVSVPLFKYEEKLAPLRTAAALKDLSQAPVAARNQAIAEELEMAALAEPVPKAGFTGEAPFYFPAIHDLIGGCAEPFYRSFLSSRSKELRRSAQSYIAMSLNSKSTCKYGVPLASP